MSADARVAAHGAALAAWEERILGLVVEGDLAGAAAWAQIAGDHAWHSPTGAVASPVIDAALRAVGTTACPRVPRRHRAPGPERVLHVATELSEVGGHSRMARRWIERDRARVPTLALTRQRGPVPAGIAGAVDALGGAVHHVEGHDALARGRALGALVDEHDTVVLHVHPFETAAAIALAHRHGRPPVLHVNHADHCFWLGADVADLVVSGRPAASAMCIARRGVPPMRTALLPVPVEPLPPADRAEARAALDVPEGACALLVVASPYKLERIDDLGLLDLVEPVLAAHPEAVLLAVGPEDADDWAAARERTGGRVRALGRMDDTSLALAAGDVFLDGYPCSSLTAALEAAAAGMCVVSHQPPRAQAATYDIDEPGLGEAHVRARTPEQYAAALERLVRDPAARERAGAEAARAVARMADPALWASGLEDVYARAAGRAACPELAPRRVAPTAESLREDAFLLRLHEASGMAIPPEVAVARGADAFPRDPHRGLAIVIHAADQRAGLERLIASAVATCDGLAQVTAVVVDDGSRDGTAAFLAGMGGDLRVVTNPAPEGAAACWQAGVACAEGEAVLLVTADVVLTPGWLEPLRAALAGPGVAAVAPRITGGTGRETCVLTSLPALRAGCAVTPVEVPGSVVLGGDAARLSLEAVA